MNNYYTACYCRRRKIGTPSWWAGLKYSIYRMLHRRRYDDDDY